MIKATKEDRDLVVDILMDAFEPIHDDSSINFVVKQDAKRKQRMRVLMEYLFDKSYRTGYVCISDNRASCLLLTYSNRDTFSFSKLFSTLRLAFKCIGIERVSKVLERQKVIQRNYPKTPYIRPMIFAVKQEYKGGVTAPKLILQVYKEFRDTKLPVIVDAANENNVKLYQKFGLSIFNKEESLGFPIYLMKMEGVPQHI
ncbi:GNAT family N-acetyltransferase [Euzebyella saccharophila]|uniref:GNAT family N-acetyltransferase n=1 Tax=Euzebyella saccharophila TaxID=679664 RepID=A0ABV8JRT3_9FLAO|nr:GNAT family N-acetyltransferase [Euzebyella saccharophila]